MGSSFLPVCHAFVQFGDLLFHPPIPLTFHNVQLICSETEHLAMFVPPTSLSSSSSW